MGSSESVFHQLISDHSSRLYRIAYRVTRDTQLAEDVVQEAFLKAYKKMDTIDDQSKISSWLSSITVRTAIDFVRVERRQSLPIDHTIIEKVNPARGENTEEKAQVSFFIDEIKQCFQQLTKEYREVLLLKAVHGLKEEEIATKLELKPATVKTRLYRARKKLKILYEQISV